MSKKVYVVSRRIRLAYEWIDRNKAFLCYYLDLHAPPQVITLDDSKLERLQGMTSCLIILVDLPAIAVRTARIMYPTQIFLDCALD